MELRVIEKKVLGALLILSNEVLEVKTSNAEIARTMGYKASGGAITFALDALEMKNYINLEGKGHYKVLI